jgi:NADH-quinone oxidoreductase subunit L
VPGNPSAVVLQTSNTTLALQVVTWIGAITAVFAALIALAQNDIKRILAYSTVSQLGYMMMGLGVGGVAVGMFHLLTHAFFKALLFLGSGSVIHGCHDEQDICRMGGLRKFMPITFATYAIGMMALCGVPIFFSGFWSKDEILHAAHGWPISHVPFYLGIFGAFLTAFYMTRQLVQVFFGNCRLEFGRITASEQRTVEHAGVPAKQHPHVELTAEAHESPAVMTIPLVILAVAAIVVGFFGTPAWPWLHSYLTGHPAEFKFSALNESAGLMIVSTIVVAIGLGSGWFLYTRKGPRAPSDPDPIQLAQPSLWRILARRFYVDELYEATVIRLNAFGAALSDWLDRVVWNGFAELAKLLVDGFARISRAIDQNVVNGGFDESCGGIRRSSGLFSRFQNGRVQSYLRVIGAAMVILVLLLLWGCRS